MTDEFDPLAGESGLLDDFDGTIKDGYFRIGTGDSSDRTFLWLLMDTDNPDTPETEVRYGLGPDWASYDGGDTVEHPQNKRTFNNQTAIIELFQTALECGAEDVLRERLRENPDAHKTAAFWKGLSFHWNVKSESRTFKDRKTGEDRTIQMNRTLPSKFLGVVEERDGTSPPPTTAPANATGPEPASTTAPASSPQSDELPAEIVAQIRLLAQSNDYSSWVDEVMGLTDSSNTPIIKLPGVMKRLSDESWYNELKG